MENLKPKLRKQITENVYHLFRASFFWTYRSQCTQKKSKKYKENICKNLQLYEHIECWLALTRLWKASKIISWRSEGGLSRLKIVSKIKFLVQNRKEFTFKLKR